MSVIHRDEFTIEGDPRRINDAAVAQLDAALAGAAGAATSQVLHGFDPRRILRFAHGGPPVWSVGLCPCPDGTFLYVTYGLSRFVDPDAPFDHEMSIRVPGVGGQPAMWPTFLLRQLARYQITSGRELKVGDPMTFAESITRAAMAPEHKGSMPDSPMRAVAVVADPAMQSVRRVLGLLDDEHALSELWSALGLVGEIARRDPALVTNVARPSWATDPTLVDAVNAGSERQGSQTGAIVVPGLRWRPTGDGATVSIPGGPLVRRVAALIRARIGFGRNLLLHDYAPAPYSEVALTPADKESFIPHGDRVLELKLPVDASMLFALNASAQEAEPSPVELTLR